MHSDDHTLMPLIDAIVVDDRPTVRRLLTASPGLATTSLGSGATRQESRDFWLEDIQRYVYRGDTPLHVAAAAYRTKPAEELIRRGAQVDARNRPRGDPAALTRPTVDLARQHGTRERNAPRSCACSMPRADPNAADKSGTMPLHRAVRNRCAAAVAALLEGGADRDATNGRGSTAAQLAAWTTGRGGSGSPEAKAQQAEIVELLSARKGERPGDLSSRR